MSKKPSAGGKIQWTKMFRKLSPYTIRKGFRYMKHYGPKEFWIRLHERFEPEEVPYGPWYRAYIPTEETLETQRKQKFDYSPLISIAVPAYQTPVEFLRQMIESLIVQTYSNWELCIVNASPDNEEMQKVLAEYSAGDSRVRFCNLKENLGIAENTNRAFAMTKGEFVGLLDHDDLLAPNALYEIVKILQDHPQLFKVSNHLVRTAHIRFTDNFDQRHTASVIINNGAVFPLIMNQFTRILFHVDLMNTDALLHTIHFYVHMTISADWQIKLRNLVSLRKIRIKIILSVEFAVLCNITI